MLHEKSTKIYKHVHIHTYTYILHRYIHLYICIYLGTLLGIRTHNNKRSERTLNLRTSLLSCSAGQNIQYIREKLETTIFIPVTYLALQYNDKKLRVNGKAQDGKAFVIFQKLKSSENICKLLL